MLAGYITYTQYSQLEKAILDDPSYDTGKARSALARFVTLHPDNLSQKAEIDGLTETKANGFGELQTASTWARRWNSPTSATSWPSTARSRCPAARPR